MSRNDRRHNNNRGRNWNNRDNQINKNERDSKSERKHENRGSGSYERRQERRRSLSQLNQKEFEENQTAIRAFKENIVVCELCHKPIEDMSLAISNKGSSNPVHFDCVVESITNSENLSLNDKVSYIGQGKFAVIHFENPHDQKHFTIKKTIEWENREADRSEWRDTMAGLYSQVK